MSNVKQIIDTCKDTYKEPHEPKYGKEADNKDNKYAEMTKRCVALKNKKYWERKSDVPL